MNLLPTIAAVGGLLGTTTVVGGFWYYATPKMGAEEVADRVAFWKGVKIEA